MLNVGQLNEGFVLDHIETGKAMDIYNYLGLGKLDCQVAIIKNARSSKMGRKDIIKIEGEFEKDDIVRIFNFEGVPVGVGKANCDSAQAREAMGKHGKKAVVHYDYLYIE